MEDIDVNREPVWLRTKSAQTRLELHCVANWLEAVPFQWFCALRFPGVVGQEMAEKSAKAFLNLLEREIRSSVAAIWSVEGETKVSKSGFACRDRSVGRSIGSHFSGRTITDLALRVCPLGEKQCGGGNRSRTPLSGDEVTLGQSGT